MSADELLQWLTQGSIVLIFLSVAIEAVRRPSRANLDITLLFGATMIVIVLGWVGGRLGPEFGSLLAALRGAVAMALPYLLLRLVDDFADVPRLLMRLAEAGLVLLVVSLFVIPPPRPVWLTLLIVLYFFGLEVYAAVVFVREARRTTGVTRRRMQAVAAGSVFLGLTVLTVGFREGLPELGGLWRGLGRIFGLATGVAYFLGFAPPAFIRRAWQEPELRAFLSRAASLPRLPDTDSIVRELEQGAAASLGAPGAAIGLWDEAARGLRFVADGDPVTVGAGEMIAGRAFASRRPIFSTDAARDDPAHADVYRAYGTSAVLAAPICAGERCLGVLSVYAPRAPIFAEDDLALVQLLADQAAVILESRELIDEAARVRAREEATRLKDDFLSAAAHDLKTPLTTLIAQAQLLERRATRTPEEPPDLGGIRRIVRESKRLNSLVRELLDAAQVERGQLGGNREVVDLAEVAREACARHRSRRHPCVLEADGPVIGSYNRSRIAQLMDNLLENAIKYSPQGGDVRVRVWCEGGEAHLAVSDRGIGIPATDLPHVFDRFRRGANVDDRRFAGMGLGLYICRGIAEQHGGRIWASSEPGRGSTFHVALPVLAEQPVAAGAAHGG